MPRVLRIGTRHSPLALAQTRQFADEFLRRLDWSYDRLEIIPIVTQGDKILEQPLIDIGGKGLFTSELEAQLKEGHLDLAVHSLKDLPVELPHYLRLGAIPERQDARDALLIKTVYEENMYALSKNHLNILSKNAPIGTASLRRQAQLLTYRPDLKIETIRGNVETRIEKLEKGSLQGIILSVAGLIRLGLEKRIHSIMPPDIMLPAAGQGALAIQIRVDDAELYHWLQIIHCEQTAYCVTAERAFLAELGGSCHMPIAAYATISNEKISLKTSLYSLEDQEHGASYISGHVCDYRNNIEDIGCQAAEQIRVSYPELVSQYAT